MTQGTSSQGEERGLSAWQMALLFLAGVAVCAVFFSAGYLVGSNERASKGGLPAERITRPPVVPPRVTAEAPSVPAAHGLSSGSPASRKEEGSEGKLQRSPRATRRASTGEDAVSEALGVPSSTSSSDGTRGDRTGVFTIQVSASGNKQDAEKVAEVLKARGYKVFIAHLSASSGGDNLYHVQVGPFARREDAERVRDQLAQEGFKQPFIKH